MTGRIVCWYSCGVASAVATKLAIMENAGKLPLHVIRIHVEEEHPDNARFHAECEAWFGVPIETVRDEKFGASVQRVWDKERYMSGVAGASCSRALKKNVRLGIQRAGDIHVFGYCVEEQDRYDRFLDGNNELRGWPILIENGLTHDDCLALVKRAAIEIPVMYRLGFRNNNCIGCCKAAGAGYWNMVRKHFPEVFAARAETSRRLGVRLIKIREVRSFLDELPDNTGNYRDEPDVKCGFVCELAEMKFGPA